MTSRRNFLRGLLVAGASIAILPGAGRIWKPRRSWIDELQEQLWVLKRRRDELGIITTPEHIRQALDSRGNHLLDSFFNGTPFHGKAAFKDLPVIEVRGARPLGIYEQLLACDSGVTRVGA